MKLTTILQDNLWLNEAFATIIGEVIMIDKVRRIYLKLSFIFDTDLLHHTL